MHLYAGRESPPQAALKLPFLPSSLLVRLASLWFQAAKPPGPMQTRQVDNKSSFSLVPLFREALHLRFSTSAHHESLQIGFVRGRCFFPQMSSGSHTIGCRDFPSLWHLSSAHCPRARASVSGLFFFLFTGLSLFLLAWTTLSWAPLL